MTAGQCVWMTSQTRERLESELTALMSLRTVYAEGTGDREGRVVDAWLARKARIREIYELLSNAEVRNVDRQSAGASDGFD